MTGNDDDDKKQLFIRDALPVSWLNYAEELGEAAEALWVDRDNGIEIEVVTKSGQEVLSEKRCLHSRSYILLAGLAIENVLKGLIIENNAKLIASGSLDKTLKTHKLLDLADKIDGLVLTEVEKQALQICQDAIPYWGRYPIPLRYQGLQPSEAVTGEFRACFRHLHFRLCKLLYDLIKDGWDSGAGPKTVKTRSILYGDTINSKEKFPWKDADKS